MFRRQPGMSPPSPSSRIIGGAPGSPCTSWFSRTPSGRTSTGTPAGPSGGGGFRGGAQPAGHRLQRLHRDRRMLLDEPAEDPLREPEEAQVALRRDGRGPGPAVEERDLAEEVPARQTRHTLPADRDLGVTVDDHEQSHAGITLAGDHGSLGVLDLLHDAGDRAELPARARREERDLLQAIDDDVVSSHGPSRCDGRSIVPQVVALLPGLAQLHISSSVTAIGGAAGAARGRLHRSAGPPDGTFRKFHAIVPRAVPRAANHRTKPPLRTIDAMRSARKTLSKNSAPRMRSQSPAESGPVAPRSASRPSSASAM